MRNSQQPWYLSDTLFSIFFWFTFMVILSGFLFTAGIFAVSGYMVSKQDFSKGVLPAVERVLCGKPGCLAHYGENQ